MTGRPRAREPVAASAARDLRPKIFAARPRHQQSSEAFHEKLGRTGFACPMTRRIERAAEAAGRFGARLLTGYMLTELQADEIRTSLNSKKRVLWVLTAIEVWSRLWVSVVLGRRSCRNVMRLLADAAHSSRFDRPPLITTDGYRYYGIVLGRLPDRGCIHCRVVKTLPQEPRHEGRARPVYRLPVAASGCS